jgi:hypothetical protein
MKKVLPNTGTVLALDLNKHEIFADITVDIAGPEMHRLLQAYFGSLPPSLQEKHKKAVESILSLVFQRYGQFEVDIKPVMNKKVMLEGNKLLV